MPTGGCRCGAIRYEVTDILRNSVCHCRDCQLSAGAPMVEWMLVDEDALRVDGQPLRHQSSPGVMRSFCGQCGTGLFYHNEAIFPGQVDIQTVTLDDPDQSPEPGAQVQSAEQRRWVTRLDRIETFDRYPGM